MSVVFQKAIKFIGFNRDTQGDASFIHALLQYADANHSGSDVLDNPVSEAIRRFKAASINPHVLARIEQMLHDWQDKYDRGIR